LDWLEAEFHHLLNSSQDLLIYPEALFRVAEVFDDRCILVQNLRNFGISGCYLMGGI
jgi:hypothetical protein